MFCTMHLLCAHNMALMCEYHMKHIYISALFPSALTKLRCIISTQTSLNSASNSHSRGCRQSLWWNCRRISGHCSRYAAGSQVLYGWMGGGRRSLGRSVAEVGTSTQERWDQKSLNTKAQRISDRRLLIPQPRKDVPEWTGMVSKHSSIPFRSRKPSDVTRDASSLNLR